MMPMICWSLAWLVITKVNAFDRIVGGTAVTVDKYPFIVSINGQCGGSILRKTYPAVIITAAHCKAAFDSPSDYVRLYTNDVGGSNADSFDSAIDRYVIHPNYQGNSNDIALLFLKEDISSNTKVKTVSIDSKSVGSECCSSGDDLQVIGYGTDCSGCGLTPTLEFVDVDYVDRATCSTSYAAAGATVDNTMNCAAMTNSDSCQGDSGGPLIKKGTNKQVGVVSWGIGCAHASYPGVYADLSIYYNWIIQQIGSIETGYESGYAVQIRAYASNGYYYLEDGHALNGDVVFSRRSSDPRFIYKLSNGKWYISKTVGGTGTFANCGKDDIRDCNCDDDGFCIEYYISAYASSGVYVLTSQTSSGQKVYSRGTTDERYIYRYGNQWLIGRYVGHGGYFSSCKESKLEDCAWLILCVTAYASNGIYRRTDEIYNDKQVYERESDGDKRVIYYNNQGYGWIISQFAGGGYFAFCNKENIRGCDKNTKIVISQCSANFGASSSLPKPIWFNHNNNIINNIALNSIISVISTISILSLIYCFCVLYKNNNKHKYNKKVPFQSVFQEDSEEMDQLKQ